MVHLGQSLQQKESPFSWLVLEVTSKCQFLVRHWKQVWQYRLSSPLGLLAPGFKELGDYFTSMNRDIEKRSEEYGLLGNSNWIGMERDSSNDLMTVMYFRDSE
jgi:hypothetical protein